jgi:protein gp37
LDCPAAVHFVSYEPALGPVDLRAVELVKPVPPHQPGVWLDALAGLLIGPDDELQTNVGWVIVGGESGPGARSFDVAWARYVVMQCRATGVPCFVKQLGARPIWRPFGPDVEGEDTPVALRLRDRKGGDWSEWPQNLRVREFPS